MVADLDRCGSIAATVMRRDVSRQVVLETLSPTDWARLREFAGRFTAESGAHGQWTELEARENGVAQIGYVGYDAHVSEFLTFMDTTGLMVPFAWLQWRGTRAVERGDLEAVGASSPDDALRFVIVMIRADRFMEGALLTGLQSGMMATALQRILLHPAAPRPTGRD